MNPSEIRARVLAEHDWLRTKLTMLETCAHVVRDGHTSGGKALRERMEDFCRSLLLHLAMEDDLLVPILSQMDAWGEVRVERMEGDHKVQREEIAQLLREGAVAQPIALAETILVFSRALRADMAHEERESLNADLLRDDTVSISQMDG